MSEHQRWIKAPSTGLDLAVVIAVASAPELLAASLVAVISRAENKGVGVVAGHRAEFPRLRGPGVKHAMPARWAKVSYMVPEQGGVFRRRTYTSACIWACEPGQPHMRAYLQRRRTADMPVPDRLRSAMRRMSGLEKAGRGAAVGNEATFDRSRPLSAARTSICHFISGPSRWRRASCNALKVAIPPLAWRF